MQLQLVLDDYDPLDIPLQDSVLEAWSLQFDRAIKAGTIADVAGRIASSIADGLAKGLDRDLQPPTEKQLRYAAAIARELNVSVSGEVLRYKGAMTEFLNRYADTFKARQVSRSHPGGTLSTPDDG